MKERPILYKGAMVRGLLAGTKKQTRRIMNPQPPADVVDFCTFHNPDGDGLAHFAWDPVARELGSWYAVCPKGQVGDRLWVRENFVKIPGQTVAWIETDYQATYKHGDRMGDLMGIKKVWKPSIHMPRDACRLVLEITEVRVQRLQVISDEDAKAEGIELWIAELALDPKVSYTDVGALISRYGTGSRAVYAALWDSINGDGAWAKNPWVWAITQRRLA